MKILKRILLLHKFEALQVLIFVAILTYKDFMIAWGWIAVLAIILIQTSTTYSALIYRIKLSKQSQNRLPLSTEPTTKRIKTLHENPSLQKEYESVAV